MQCVHNGRPKIVKWNGSLKGQVKCNGSQKGVKAPPQRQSNVNKQYITIDDIFTPRTAHTLLYFSYCEEFVTLSSSSVTTVFSESASDCIA